MALDAGVRDLQRGGGCGSDEFEGMGAHVDVPQRLLDFRHVAVHTLAAGAACFMMRVLGN